MCAMWRGDGGREGEGALWRFHQLGLRANKTKRPSCCGHGSDFNWFIIQLHTPISCLQRAVCLSLTSGLLEDLVSVGQLFISFPVWLNKVS